MKILSVIRKEFSSFFSSPVAFIFLGVYLAVSLFTFFWAERFFERNLVDVRPLFDWLPVLLIFLVSALTMRMWSEERRQGTMELLFTTPVKIKSFVLGKFFACLLLVSLALILTMSVPASVSLLGALDLGPVIAAYLAALLLAAAYIAIGLFLSSKTDNQIVSLILTISACSILYLVGSEILTQFSGNKFAEFLRLLGSGSRFESVSRGILDFRDIFYYLSITFIFLLLTTASLESLRFSKVRVRKLTKFVLLFLIANLLLANITLHNVKFLRWDLTADKIYSISVTTDKILTELKEPLVIKGYFSDRTHKKLSPLVQHIKDMLHEYETASDKIKVEISDPRGNAELEEEIKSKYGIRPTPFQVAEQHEASIINSYFDIAIQYGDKSEVLGFRDLIDLKFSTDGEPDIILKNLEYDLTRSIKKVIASYNSPELSLASLTRPVKLEWYLSSDKLLPDKLKVYAADFQKTLDAYIKESNSKLSYEVIDPAAGDANIAKEIAENYGFRPMVASLEDPQQFYFYAVLLDGDTAYQIPFPEQLNEDGAKRSLETVFKRLAPGFLKTIAIVAPQAAAGQNPGSEPRSFSALETHLRQTRTVRQLDLASGVVPEDVDALLVLAPENLDPKKLYAIDQFLMRGGTVVLATSSVGVTRSQLGLQYAKVESGLEEWLKFNGVEIESNIVLDSVHDRYPVPVTTDGDQMELVLAPYPPFVALTSDGINSDILGANTLFTVAWGSPLKIQPGKRKQIDLIKSSKDSWTLPGARIEPNYDLHKEGFEESPQKSEYLLGAIQEGGFDSYFKDKQNPILEPQDPKAVPAEQETNPSTFVSKSPDSARLIVLASNESLNDLNLQISQALGSSRYLNSLLAIDNILDWSLEDRSMLSLRNAGYFSRTIDPRWAPKAKMFEFGNYLIAVFALLIVILISSWVAAVRRRRHAIIYGGLK